MDEERTPANTGRRAHRDQSYPAGHQDHELPEGVEPDFSDDVGTNDPLEAVEDAEPYFPPTDPVIAPATKGEEGVEIVGGFAPTSMDEQGFDEDAEPGMPRGDEAIAAAVERELLEDAETTDLHLEVEVREGVVYLRGTVPGLEDADAAAEVAARVDGVAEVLDETEVQGLSA